MGKKLGIVLPLLAAGLLFAGLACNHEEPAQPPSTMPEPPETEAPAAPAAAWTCSMHPQVRLVEPGRCPICGMDLVPVEAEPETPAPMEPMDMGGRAQTTCPVMGGAINRDIFVDHEGKRVYFCCAGCETAFRADPERYLTQFAEQGVELEDAPAATD